MPGLFTGASGLFGGFPGLLYGGSALSTPPGLLADAVYGGGTPAGILLGQETSGMAMDFTSSPANLLVRTATSLQTNYYSGLPFQNEGNGPVTFTRTSNATVTDSNGFIKWAGHNLLTNSESFGATAWTKYNGGPGAPTLTAANAAVAPNGTTTADDFLFPAIVGSTQEADVIQQVTVPSGTFTGGVWVKAKSAGDVGKRFTVAAYSFTSATLFALTHHTLTSDWVLVTASGSCVAGAIQFYFGTVGSIYAGGGNQAAFSCYVWGAHLYRSDLGGMVLNPARGDAYYPTTPRNLLGFTESLTTGWTNSNTTDSIVTETNPNGLASSVEVTATAGNGTLLGSLSLLASPYTFSIWLKRKTGTGTVQITVDGTTYVAAAVTGTWTRFSTTLTPTAGTKTPGIRLVTSGDAVFAWGAQLSDSASLDAYSPVYGAAVTSAAYYAPRLDFDPVTLAARGLLVEEQRVNLLTYSNVFNNVAWSSQLQTVATSPTTAGPDGVLGAFKITADTSNAEHFLENSFGVLTNQAYTASVYAKADNGVPFFSVAVVAVGAASTVSYCFIQNSSGVLSALGQSGIVTSNSVTPVGGGWYRITITYTLSGTITSHRFRIYSIGTSTSSVAAGDGTSGVAIFGAQVEGNATFATSYIPTIASATRTADVASVSTQAFPYSASEGTVVVNCTSFVPGTTAGSRFSALLFDGNAYPNVIRLEKDGSDWRVVKTVGGSSVFNTIPYTQNTITKIGAVYADGNSASSFNGAAAVALSGGIPVAATLLGIGGNGLTGVNNTSGHIRQITYIPRRLSNSELQARTV